MTEENQTPKNPTSATSTSHTNIVQLLSTPSGTPNPQPFSVEQTQLGGGAKIKIDGIDLNLGYATSATHVGTSDPAKGLGSSNNPALNEVKKQPKEDSSTFAYIKSSLEITKLGTGIGNDLSSARFHFIQAREVERDGYRKDKKAASDQEEVTYQKALKRIHNAYAQKDEDFISFRNRMEQEEPGKLERLVKAEIKSINEAVQTMVHQDGKDFNKSRPSTACLMM